jgi:hypothetical protein
MKNVKNLRTVLKFLSRINHYFHFQLFGRQNQIESAVLGTEIRNHFYHSNSKQDRSRNPERYGNPERRPTLPSSDRPQRSWIKSDNGRGKAGLNLIVLLGDYLDALLSKVNGNRRLNKRLKVL